APATVSARLRRALPAAHHAGGPGLRLRLPRGHGADAGSRDPLSLAAMRNLAPGALVDFVAAVMRGGGSNADEAHAVARRLVDANLVGHDSHGVIRVGKYLEWVRLGWLVPNARPAFIIETDTLAIIDGNRGFGQVIGEIAAQRGVAKAKRTGIA